MQQPGALLAQGHEAVQLRGVHVLADVKGGFERVLDMERGHLGLVLLSALEEDGGEGETMLGSAGPKNRSSHEDLNCVWFNHGLSMELTGLYVCKGSQSSRSF